MNKILIGIFFGLALVGGFFLFRAGAPQLLSGNDSPSIWKGPIYAITPAGTGTLGVTEFAPGVSTNTTASAGTAGVQVLPSNANRTGVKICVTTSTATSVSIQPAYASTTAGNGISAIFGVDCIDL